MRKAGADMDDLFQSTLSVRRATRHIRTLPNVLCISIHALRKESDVLMAKYYYDRLNFNPRSP